jgi:UDPglucose--hexose-1-phosphate uridylyltransferase
MPDLRTDWLTGRTVLIAENRANRPNEFDTYQSASASSDGKAPSSSVPLELASACPFCPGNEADTPPASYEQFDDQNRWRLRIIPNKFPAVTLTDGSAFGAHEVVVETARHVDRTSSLSEFELRNVLEAYAVRLRHWSADDRLAYGLVFKNQGPRAGASIAHLHSQLIALPAVPAAVESELCRASEAVEQKGSCGYCRLIEQERESKARIVHDGDGYAAFCPYASVQPCEVWIMPTAHEPSFEHALSAGSTGQLAKILRALLVRIESLIPSASYNFLLRTAPWKLACGDWFHWRIELVPRVNAIAGLETATAIYVNPVSPERAAAELRRTML